MSKRHMNRNLLLHYFTASYSEKQPKDLSWLPLACLLWYVQGRDTCTGILFQPQEQSVTFFHPIIPSKRRVATSY